LGGTLEKLNGDRLSQEAFESQLLLSGFKEGNSPVKEGETDRVPYQGKEHRGWVKKPFRELKSPQNGKFRTGGAETLKWNQRARRTTLNASAKNGRGASKKNTVPKPQKFDPAFEGTAYQKMVRGKGIWGGVERVAKELRGDRGRANSCRTPD